MKRPERPVSGRTIPAGWYTQLWDWVKSLEVVSDGNLQIDRMPGGTLLRAIPQPERKQPLQQYEGAFSVLAKEGKEVRIKDPFDAENKIAGYAYINGVYTEVKAATVPLDEEKLTDGIVTLPDGQEAAVKEGYISLALDPEGKTFFALTPELRKRIYTGEFSVEYNHKEDRIVVVDGSDAKSGYAGHVFRNGEYMQVPAGSMEVQEGTLCIVLDSSGSLYYKIITKTAQHRIYDGEFTVQHDPESGLIEVFDGTYGTGNAGHVFLDGKWTSVSAASLIPKEGYLCLRYSAEAGVTFAIVDKPEIKLAKWKEPAKENITEKG